jgi:type VI secretion system protein ImpB
MGKSFQHEKPPARINLFLDVKTGDAIEKVELPLRMLVMGDFGGADRDSDLIDRELININKDNFQDVLREQEVSMDFTVKNTLKGGDEEMKVHLDVDDMKSFDPEQVARQIPELDKLLAARNLLQDLRNRVISLGDFRKQLESIIKDKDALAKLAAELQNIVPADESGSEEE